MQVIDFLKKATVQEKDPDAVRQIEELYQEPLYGAVNNLFSHVGEPLFLEDKYFAKILSLQEILDAGEDMNVDFVGQKIIPLIDTGDNDYICYRINTRDWCRYNIVDELAYDPKSRILDYYI